MNKYQKMINKIAKLDAEYEAQRGLSKMSFRESRNMTREVHKGDSLGHLKRYKEYWHGPYNKI